MPFMYLAEALPRPIYRKLIGVFSLVDEHFLD